MKYILDIYVRGVQVIFGHNLTQLLQLIQIVGLGVVEEADGVHLGDLGDISLNVKQKSVLMSIDLISRTQVLYIEEIFAHSLIFERLFLIFILTLCM